MHDCTYCKSQLISSIFLQPWDNSRIESPAPFALACSSQIQTKHRQIALQITRFRVQQKNNRSIRSSEAVSTTISTHIPERSTACSFCLPGYRSRVRLSLTSCIFQSTCVPNVHISTHLYNNFRVFFPSDFAQRVAIPAAYSVNEMLFPDDLTSRLSHQSEKKLSAYRCFTTAIANSRIFALWNFSLVQPLQVLGLSFLPQQKLKVASLQSRNFA